MIKGYLKILFLKELKKKECSGYDFMKRAEIVLGKKPSSGSVYPLFKQLLESNYIDVKKIKNKKVYSINKDGEKLLDNLTKEKQKMLINTNNMMKLFNKVEKSDKSIFMINEKNCINEKLIRNLHNIMRLKDQIDRVLHNKYVTIKEEKLLNEILKDATKKIKKIKIKAPKIKK